MERYDVTGMSCAACQARIEKAVGRVPGVTSCNVNLISNSMQVEGTASSEKIIKAVTDAGYGASLKGGSSSSVRGSYKDDLTDRTTAPLIRRFFISLVFLLMLLYLSMGHMMFGLPLPPALSGNHTGIALIQMVLAAIVMVINQRFFISGTKGIVHGGANMDTLISLGSAASFIYSLVILFLMTCHPDQSGEYMKELYFESSAMILSLVTLGKALESYSKGRTADSLRSLMKLRPDTASVIREGEEVIIPVSELKVGDIFIVKSGESIPADGRITEGTAAIDESALTGESIPVDKGIGDQVSCATINNAGYIKCEAVKVGSDTLFSKIIETVSDASASKAPVARLADRISAVFVPAVLGIAFITVMIWLLAGSEIGFALARGITVLVVSCPCALGLATPVAIMAGSGVGAKNGILFKNATALQELGKTEIVCLDKTGTITTGEPSVIDIIPIDIKEKELLSVALSVERLSEHPIAGAIVRKAEEAKASPLGAAGFEVFPGNGISAMVSGGRILAGSVGFTSPGEDITKMCAELSSLGKTPVVFKRNGHVIGVISVADKIRDDARQAVDELLKMGIRPVMITGDNERTASKIASDSGITEVISGVLPSEKKDEVGKLSRSGKTAMVGDGINDAPALAASDIGIAMGGGTDVAADSASVVLMKPGLTGVPSAIRLSRCTYSIIKQNLFWALIYNVLLIPLAAGVYIIPFGIAMEPVYGAAAMSISSFFVVTNALRLNLIDIKDPSRDRKIRHRKRRLSEYSGATDVTIGIEGMMCSHCEEAVKKALKEIGAAEVKADHPTGKATAVFPGGADPVKIKKALKDAGYKMTGLM
ncbi:MAG: cadmium-translocating P-type ATPase [Clostridiales bacterium]|nr:cadmium-translocating P-type ATPase [Clostridiales bacterium]